MKKLVEEKRKVQVKEKCRAGQIGRMVVELVQ